MDAAFNEEVACHCWDGVIWKLLLTKECKSEEDTSEVCEGRLSSV